MANRLRVSGQIQDKDRYISISETKRQMVAMLTELQSRMANQENPYGFSGSGHGGWQRRNKECQDLVQEKINALRG